MHAAVRPWVTTGVALVSGAVIAVTPVAPPPPALTPQAHIPEVHLPAVQLSASIADIFTFPAFRQYILNQINDLVTLGVGLGGSAAGLGQSIALIPETLRTVTQQVLSGDLLGALTTIEVALVGSIVAIGEPTLDAIIQRRQRILAVQQALQVAVPQAFFDVVGGVGLGLDEVARAFIVAGQGLVDAVLSLNLGNIVDSLVNGTALVLGSFVTGGQHVVDGIVSAQQVIATALAAQPAPASATAFSTKVASAEVTDVPDLSRKTSMVAVDPPTDAGDANETESTRDTTKLASLEEETSKADDDPAPKGGTTVAADKSDQSTPSSPKRETKKKPADSPKHETATAENESESEGAKQD
jgi:hypothetical protein